MRRRALESPRPWTAPGWSGIWIVDPPNGNRHAVARKELVAPMLSPGHTITEEEIRASYGTSPVVVATACACTPPARPADRWSLL